MKIALISSNPHNRIGGTETYARNLIRALGSKNEITEFPIMMGGSVIGRLDPKVVIDECLVGTKPDDLIWHGTYKKNRLRKIYGDFDVVILNNVFPPKSVLSNKKTVLIQHMDTRFYSFKGKPILLGIGSFFSWFFFNVSGTIGNPFKKASNVVFFDESTSCETEANKYFVPLPSEKVEKNKHKRTGYVWISRLDNPQKNVKDAVSIANNCPEFRIFGSGNGKKIIKRSLANEKQFGGALRHDEVINILSRSKALILTSNWEGFPFIIVEALHSGTPVIAYDTFKSLEFFKKSKMVKCANDKDEIIDMINNDFSLPSTDFAEKELSLSKFKKNWEKILEDVNEK